MNNIIASYPANYTKDDFRDEMKWRCQYDEIEFSEDMITDEAFYDFCDNQDEFDYECFVDALHSEVLKTKIKKGFLEIKNGGWRQQHGMTDVFDVDASSILEKIRLSGGGQTIEFYKNGHTLGFTRYSHDEPTGASIELHSMKKYDSVRSAIFN